MLERLWPSDAPLFGDVADKDHCGASRPCNAGEYLGATADLANTSCWPFELSERCCLNGVDDQEGRATALCRLGNCAHFTLGKNLYGVGRNCGHEAEPFGAIGNLRRRLFARRIEDASAGECDPCSGLQQQRALADAWFTAEQDDGARHGATTKNAIKLGDSEREARCAICAGRSQRLWLHRSGSRSSASGTSARRGSITNRLNQGFKFAAIRTSTCVCGRNTAAGLADPVALALRHAANALVDCADRLSRHSGGRSYPLFANHHCDRTIDKINHIRCADRICPLEQALGEWILDERLDGAAERAGAIRDVVPDLDEVILCRIGDNEIMPLRAQLRHDALDEQVDDATHLLLVERPEDDARINAIEELWAERLLQLLVDLLADQRVLVCSTGRLALAA